MSLQKKYFAAFKDLQNKSYDVEIWEDSVATITAVEVRTDINSVKIPYPEAGIFDPVKGSGAEFSFICETTGQFYDLLTADFMKYQVRIKRNGGIVWQGFLDSELYAEPYDDADNYPIHFSATDGLSLLNRLRYLDSSNNPYTGVVTQWSVIAKILKKLGLTWSAVLVNISTTSPDLTLSTGETIFHKTYIRNDNYYNEDGDPESCRKVIEEILRPYGAFLILDGNVVIITDVNTILSGTVTFLQYGVNFTYTGTLSRNMNCGDLSDIGFAGMGQQLNIETGVNRQVVKYSPYRQIDIIDYKASDDFSGTGTDTTFGTAPYRWKETAYPDSQSFSLFNYGKFIKMQGIEDDKNVDYYLKIDQTHFTNPLQKQFEYKGKLPYFLPSGYKMRVSMSGYFRLSADLENPSYVPDFLSEGKLYADIIIGGKKFDNATTGGTWVDVATAGKVFAFNFGGLPTGGTGGMTAYAPIEDKWTASGDYVRRGSEYTLMNHLVTLDDVALNGDMSFIIYGFLCEDMGSADASVLDARFKDIRFTIVDRNGDDLEDVDLEYVGDLDPLFENEGDEVTIYQGVNVDEFPIERGALLKQAVSGYSNMTQWTRAAVTDKIEELLLRTLVSNYKKTALQLKVKVNRIDSLCGFFTYSNYLTPSFLVKGATHNLEEDNTELSLIEIVSDDLTIVKEY